jgi:RNA polymerase sigma-70 factor (ECF subfamily)
MSEARVALVVPDHGGGHGGFDRFYSDEYPHTLAIVAALCGSWSAAEELTQEAFVRALRRWDDLCRMERPDAWVRRVACNLATSRFRRLLAETRALVRFDSRQRAATDPPMTDDTATFWQYVRELPPRQAQVVALFYGDDLSVATVAEVLGIAEGTVKTTLHAARQRLAERYPPPETE